MATHDDVRRILAGLPDTTFEVEESGRVAGGVAGKGICWTWMERVDPKKPKVPNLGVLAVRVDGQETKEELLAAEPDVFFTEPHYNGYPAVLVRLDLIEVDELAELLTDGWRRQAPRRLVNAFEAGERSS